MGLYGPNGWKDHPYHRFRIPVKFVTRRSRARNIYSSLRVGCVGCVCTLEIPVDRRAPSVSYGAAG